MLTKNLGGIDRILRTGIGLVMIYLGSINTQIITDELAGVVLAAIGYFLIIVAIFAICPLYKLIDFTSISKKNTDS